MSEITDTPFDLDTGDDVDTAGAVVVFEEPEPEPEPEEPAVVVFEEPEPEPAVVEAAPPALTGTVEKSYSSAEVVGFFDKSKQWLYWGMRTKDASGATTTPVFVYQDGTPIEPVKVGKGNRRRYTLPIIREMALACYRRGNLKERGFYEAVGKNAAGVKISSRAATAKEAREQFDRDFGYAPDDVSFVVGLREVLARITAAERDELVIAK